MFWLKAEVVALLPGRAGEPSPLSLEEETWLPSFFLGGIRAAGYAFKLAQLRGAKRGGKEGNGSDPWAGARA